MNKKGNAETLAWAMTNRLRKKLNSQGINNSKLLFNLKSPDTINQNNKYLAGDKLVK